MFRARDRLNLVSTAASVLAAIGLIAVASAGAQESAERFAAEEIPQQATGAPFDLRDFDAEPTPATRPARADRAADEDETTVATADADAAAS